MHRYSKESKKPVSSQESFKCSDQSHLPKTDRGSVSFSLALLQTSLYYVCGGVPPTSTLKNPMDLMEKSRLLVFRAVLLASLQSCPNRFTNYEWSDTALDISYPHSQPSARWWWTCASLTNGCVSCTDSTELSGDQHTLVLTLHMTRQTEKINVLKLIAPGPITLHYLTCYSIQTICVLPDISA